MPVKKWFLLFLMMGNSLLLLAQPPASVPGDSVSIFDKIARSVSNFKPHTTPPPEDKITHMIRTLRTLRGGFNINEALLFKLEEDRRKGEMPVADLQALENFFTSGVGKGQLDNAVVWIYRDLFTYKELKGLVRFYKTSAGQKLASDFPIIMLQSLAAAEMLKTEFMNGLQKK